MIDRKIERKTGGKRACPKVCKECSKNVRLVGTCAVNFCFCFFATTY